MATIQTPTDRTVQIFDQFYDINLVIDANNYEVVYSYFQSVTNSTTIAKSYTTSLFIIAQQTGIPIMTLLENVKGANNRLEIDATMAYYLNSIKTKTVMYGVGVVPKPNQQVQRNILN